MKKQVMLERIQIKKLFDRFTYDINVKNGKNVSVLIAPNGCGKTTIFKLIDCIFSTSVEKYLKIRSIPFENCYCTLSNNKIIGLEIRKTTANKKRRERSDRLAYVHRMRVPFYKYEKEGEKAYLVFYDGEEHDEICISDIFVEEFTYIDEDVLFFDSLPSEKIEQINMDEDDVPAIYRRMISRLSNIKDVFAEFRKKHGCELDVNFISADRLHSNNLPTRRRSYVEARENEDFRIDPISTMQDDVKRIYRDTDSEYKKLISEARDQLPKMFLDAHDETKLSFEEFEKLWKEYVHDMEKYYQLGLIESPQTIIENSELEKSFEHYSVFLDVYLNAFKRTLAPWENIYDRMKLLADILDKRNRVTGKKIKYGPDGLIISMDEKELPLNCLSSGEKNDLIMFYNLIFSSKDGGLVLVDEPEISLHIEWQEEYLDCLLKICKMNKLQAIVATHSPNIVNGHIELYAERGLQDER